MAKQNKFTAMSMILSILMFFSLGSCIPNSTTILSSGSIQSHSDSLKTGWYYITTKELGIEKRLKGTGETFYINPIPIVTIKNFKEINIYQSNYGNYGLTIKLDKKGTKEWSSATQKMIGQRLALIIDNELMHVPIVNDQIDSGLSALNRGDLTIDELSKIKITLENEEKR
jgi:preprotein translocase subunit SecD